MEHKMRIETKCIQEGWKPRNGEPRVLPIYQSTTYKYDSTKHVGKLFNLEVPGHMYSRISNPTVECVEQKIAALEGGVGAMLCASGQAATLISIMNIAHAGDSIVSASNIYGGTFNLLKITLAKFGIEVIFVDPDKEDLEKYVKPNTKAIFGETIANASLKVFDIAAAARIAHKHGLPLIVDNTFPTPVLCRPFEFGADIVIHSTTKYMDGHATVVGGCIVDSGKFDWTNGKFPGLTEPDDSYHGLSYVKTFGSLAYIVKARVQLMRDLGANMTAQTAFLLNLGLETLALRMERHSYNAQKVAEYLANHPKAAWVHYPSLKGDSEYARAQKYLPKGSAGVISFGVKGGREAAVKFMDGLKLAAIVVHVADARTCVLHPASATHRQLSDADLTKAGIQPELIRLSVGIEHVDDIIEDLEQSFANL